MSKTVVGIRFKEAGRTYHFAPGDLPLELGDGVIVETSRGIEYGEVTQARREITEEQIVSPLKEILRKATEEDIQTHNKNSELEKEAFAICEQKALEHKLDMKLVDVEYTFDGSKVTFFFTSEGRIDFRDLVKDLASKFKTRIELRQIGVRDEAKMLGGLGSCGRPVCCKTFLEDFQPVSIKMAKEQNLSLSPTKISGLCGRLMCCLKYEQDNYECMRKCMPRVNRDVITVDGKGLVIDNNVITEQTKVRLTLPDGTVDVREYHFSDVRRTGDSPEEDEALKQELLKISRAKNVKPQVAEDEFRFVTGVEYNAPAETQNNEHTRNNSENKGGGHKGDNRNSSGRNHKNVENKNFNNKNLNHKNSDNKSALHENNDNDEKPQGIENKNAGHKNVTHKSASEKPYQSSLPEANGPKGDEAGKPKKPRRRSSNKRYRRKPNTDGAKN